MTPVNAPTERQPHTDPLPAAAMRPVAVVVDPDLLQKIGAELQCRTALREEKQELEVKLHQARLLVGRLEERLRALKASGANALSALARVLLSAPAAMTPRHLSMAAAHSAMLVEQGPLAPA